MDQVRSFDDGHDDDDDDDHHDFHYHLGHDHNHV